MIAKEKKTPQVYLFYGEESFLVSKMAATIGEPLAGTQRARYESDLP